MSRMIKYFIPFFFLFTMTASYAEATKESPNPKMSPEQNKKIDDYVENWSISSGILSRIFVGYSF